MKIRQLHINRFGHFSECDLVFVGDGLQVIYGPNEAGKTTLLEFLRGLLFDFPARTPYDFGGQGEMAGVATLELRDGRAVELRRRKGNKDKVAIKLDGQPTDLDDVAWLRLLDHADRGLFESVFAFGLDQLSRGEETLKHESLQSALFGGSLGGSSSPDKVTAELSRQADEMFKKGGSKPAINALLAELKRLTKDIKDRSLRPEKFHEAETAVTTSAERATSLHEQVDQLRRRHSKIEKQARAWPKWNELQQRRGERAALGDGAHDVGWDQRRIAAPARHDQETSRDGGPALEASLSHPTRLPADARQQLLTLNKDLKAQSEERERQTNEIKQAELGLTALKLDPGAVDYQAEIKSCVEQRQSFIDARNDLPEIQRKRTESLRQIDRELAELRPGWSHDDLRAFSVDAATSAEIDRLSGEQDERSTSRTKLATKRDGDAENLDRARDELAEIGSPHDVTALAAVLADEADYVANRQQGENASGELTKLERKLATQVRKLTPPLRSGTTAPDELPVPRRESVAEFESRFDDLNEQRRIEQGSFDEDEIERNGIEQTLATAVSSRVVPSLEERDAARTRRDAGWNLVRRKYIAGEKADAAITAWLEEAAADSLPDGYEQTVRTADNIADQIYDNANEVAEREGLRRQLATLATRLDQKRQRIVELETQRAALQTAWLALWQPCGFEPLAPAAMLGWLNDHEAVCATMSQRDERLAEQSQLSERIASFEQRLRACCPVAPPTRRALLDPADSDISILLASAKQSVEETKEQQRRRADLQKEIRRLEKQLTKYDDELQTLATSETKTNAEWQAVLRRLNLPADWDADLARKVINGLRTTRVTLDTLPDEEARIEAMQSRINRFEKSVRSLCESLDTGLLREPCELAVVKLSEQVGHAIEAQREHDGLTRKLSAARDQLKSLNERHARLDDQRSQLFALAGAQSEAQFLEVVSRAERVAKLDADIDQLQREVDLIRAGDDRDEFEHSLSAGELAVLQGLERDLRDELKEAESARKTADGDEALARAALARLDGSGEVAILMEELSRKRSQLASEVDRYLPLVYARHLLNAAVRRFEKENQPEMIATISRLLNQMTGGRYVEFDRGGSGRQLVLIRQPDGVEKAPDQLSTGTREQLYLAIRLAYVLHYCEKNQPLPIIIDDVLVNFDEARTRQTLLALADLSKSVQVLFFTCHPHLVTLAQEIIPGLKPVAVPSPR